MKGSTVSDAKKIAFDRPRSIRSIASIAVLALGTIVSAPRNALADEGGVSFWLPGFFGSLAAAPQQPGWSLTSIYYHTSVSAGADVARAREFEIGRIPVNLTANVSASLAARADLALALPTYTFATPVFGGQLTVGAIGIYGGVNTSLAGSVAGIDEKCMAHARECVRLAGLTDDQEVRDQLIALARDWMSLLGRRRRRRRRTTTAKCWSSHQQSSVVAATGYGCPCVTQVHDGFPE